MWDVYQTRATYGISNADDHILSVDDLNIADVHQAPQDGRLRQVIRVSILIEHQDAQLPVVTRYQFDSDVLSSHALPVQFIPAAFLATKVVFLLGACTVMSIFDFLATKVTFCLAAGTVTSNFELALPIM